MTSALLKIYYRCFKHVFMFLPKLFINFYLLLFRFVVIKTLDILSIMKTKYLKTFKCVNGVALDNEILKKLQKKKKKNQ